MAYDNYENTAFDLNHDGHIDSNEAAFIHDTFCEESEVCSSCVDCDDSDIGGGWYPTDAERKKMNDDMQKLRNDVAAEQGRHILIAIGVIVAILLFIGNNIIGALVLLGFFMLGSMFGWWT